MSADFYQAIDISTSLAVEPETRGGRTKFWVEGLYGDGVSWLLKIPRDGTGEHWAEKIAFEIGLLLGVNVARVELARYGGKQATVCESFVPSESGDGDSEAAASEWAEGWEVLKSAMPDYDNGAIRPNREHNVKNIAASIARMASGKDLDALMKDLASYALLDGVIGNTDRHHENWMVEIRRGDGRAEVRAAPSYDHASSLGRELSDSRRRRFMSAEGGVLKYLKRGKGGVYVNRNRGRAPSPFRLARLISRWNADLARDFAERLNAAPDASFRAAIDRIPPDFMSDAAKDFAYLAVTESRNELLRSIE